MLRYSPTLVLRPVSPVTECLIILRPKESYFERSRVYFDIQVEKISLHITSEQMSDVFDFIKAQSYTTFYGTEIVNDVFSIYFIFLKDRCREYRQLLLQESIGKERLTQEQKERIHVISFTFNK